MSNQSRIGLKESDGVVEKTSNGNAAVSLLRAHLASSELEEAGRLPPERELSEELGLSRAELRKALSVLEQEGQIWRHVGKGTFLGRRPIDSISDVTALARKTSPAEMMRARLVIEPEIARAAALTATGVHLAEMRLCHQRSREAATWRQYESLDTRLHRTIAEATQNAPLLGIFDTLNALRRAVTWGRLRSNPVRPEPDHHSFTDHETIIEAIANRDMSGAAAAMRAHLQKVERNLLARQGES